MALAAMNICLLLIEVASVVAVSMPEHEPLHEVRRKEAERASKRARERVKTYGWLQNSVTVFAKNVAALANYTSLWDI